MEFVTDEHKALIKSRLSLILAGYAVTDYALDTLVILVTHAELDAATDAINQTTKLFLAASREALSL